MPTYRLLPLATLLATTLAMTLAATPADAATSDTPTCEGVPATLVGTPGQRLDGTTGRDVIVTDGATPVFGYAGDDLVCSTGSVSGAISVDEGDDIVDTTGSSAESVSIYTGSGDDQVVGGAVRDIVDLYGGGADTITTGDGFDLVFSSNPFGPSTIADTQPDTIDLGSGDDAVYGQLAVGSTVQGGPGTDLLSRPLGGRDGDEAAAWVYDATAGRVTRDGATVLGFVGFESYSLAFVDRSDSFLGSARAEDLTASGTTAATVRLGGGDDTYRRSQTDFAVDAGPGTDTFVDSASTVYTARAATRVVIDLTQGTVDHVPTRGSAAVHGTLAGFEDVTLATTTAARVIGDASPNVLRVDGACSAQLNGLAGDDHLRYRSTAANPACAGGDLRGGRGDDVLIGSSLHDRLLGGDGHDKAYGNGGRDRCVAEVRLGCES